MAQNDLNQKLIALAKNNADGVRFTEPRCYYDSLTMPSTVGNIAFGTPDVFRNGEQFPVRITHILAGYRPNSATANDPKETLVQRANLRIMQHDNYYMNQNFVPLPHWANTIMAAPDLVVQGSCSWKFPKPFVLSTRDTMQVRVVQEFATVGSDITRPLSVSFTGYGLESGAPVFIESEVDVFTNVIQTLPTDTFRNDGAEPWVITGMSLVCGALTNDSDPEGDITQMRVGVTQVGNGTNTKWESGPIGTLNNLQLCPALLWGATSGRAIVHTIPGDGWIWEPGEGVSVEATESVSISSSKLGISMLGYIMVM